MTYQVQSSELLEAVQCVVTQASEELTQNFVQRLVQIGLAILVTVPPLLVYLHWNALESDDNSAEQAPEPSHFMFFLRGLFY